MVDYLSLLCVGCSQVSCFAHQERYNFFSLPLLSYVPEETLVIFHISSQVQLAVPWLSNVLPALLSYTPIIIPGCISLLPWLAHSFFLGVF